MTQEARKANVVGFMRKGRIIEENSPGVLMRKYQHNVRYCFSSYIDHFVEMYVDETNNSITCVDRYSRRSSTLYAARTRRQIVTSGRTPTHEPCLLLPVSRRTCC